MELGGHPAIVNKPRGAIAMYSLAHGAGAGMRHHFMEELAEALAAHKIATARWEFPYMAAGKKRTDPAPVAEAAVRAVWDALPTTLPKFAGGKSFGGRMSARAAPLADCRGYIFLGFPLVPPGKDTLERAEHLYAITDPMLFVQGTRDEFAPPAMLATVLAKLPTATHHPIEGGGHGFERPKKTIDRHGDPIAEAANVISTWVEARLAACGPATRRGTRRS